MGGRVLIFLYGVVSYVAFLAALLYAIGFVGEMVVPKSIDDGEDGPLGTALAVNIALLAAFAIQHSVMARPAFKQQWTKVVPKPIERSTFVLFTSLVLFLLYWQWRPMTGEIWHVDNSVGSVLLLALFWIGWLTVLASTFMIDHFELFGLKQTYFYLIGREIPPASFKTPLLYQLVRHPIMLGFIIAFWATPTMSAGHLLFAAVTTVYILIAIRIEEHDLVGLFGDEYREYRKQTSLILPIPKPKATKANDSSL